MRLVEVTVRCLLLCEVLVGLSCVSGNKIRADGEVIQADISRARKSGAYRCAPRELALAESHLDFAYGEISEGNSTRALDHSRIAEENVKKALVLSKDCGPKQVLIKEKKEPVIVKVEVQDKDADGVPDPQDRCPEIPGPKENDGCPLVRDTDGDGIPDDLDRCPLDPEDKDGFQDEDGCPDTDNDQDGIVDKVDQCPNEPGPLDNKGCPVKDRDHDGILDHLDKCPDDPEDKDGFEDEDGCPDLDNDKDGIPDPQDACRDEPGVADPDPKKNGCPRKLSLVVVKKDRIEIKQQINFEFGKAVIKGKVSFEILDQVIQVLNDFPTIKKLRVEGHTDSVGNDAMNMKLSQNRSDSVRKYLESHGIEPRRLESSGFGETKPIASNATEKGRAQNRRTEFNIAERD
jgi:outer membrane protein OmpA-like peptidoglycan-associated protein